MSVTAKERIMMIKLLEKRGGDSQVRDEVNVRHILIKPSEIRRVKACIYHRNPQGCGMSSSK